MDTHNLTRITSTGNYKREIVTYLQYLLCEIRIPTILVILIVGF